MIISVDYQLPSRGTMPECQNCGSFVTVAYARVFTPTGVDEPRVCPACEDLIRDGAEIRRARSPRNN